MTATNAAPNQQKRVFASPLARRLSRDNNVALDKIIGSGPHGRIIKVDVVAALNSPSAQKSIAAPVAPISVARAPTITRVQLEKIYAERNYELVELNNVRKTIANRLQEAKGSIPHFYLTRDVILDPLLKLRRDVNAGLATRDIKLSVNDFIIKACAIALQNVPAANAIWADDCIFRMQASDVAVAVAVEGGLYTPVLTNAEHKTLSALSTEMKDLAIRARANKLSPQEYQGGSFTISNLGMYGIDNFKAIINPPHAAILAVGAGVKKPIVNEQGDVAVASVMSLTLSVDHRVIDGALGAELLKAIKSNLENPMSMLV